MHDRFRIGVLRPALAGFFGHVFEAHDHFNFGIQLLYIEVNRLLTVTAEKQIGLYQHDIDLGCGPTGNDRPSGRKKWLLAAIIAVGDLL
ncbi:hypothetical protein ACTVM6_07550, partial [Serratia bockelmannii]|uniref:hypothetical protein n=1 Tax=Serratia bockelmannii TaxID=2703793 RepID=UPI003FA6E5B0